MTPKFSAYPWDRIARMSRREAAVHSMIARWVGARGGVEARAVVGSAVERGRRLATLVGAKAGEVRARIGGASEDIDPHAAGCTVRVPGAEVRVFGSSAGVRAIVQRMLGGPEELSAPRPLGVVEQSIWSLVIATALEDLGVVGQVWPIVDGGARARAHRRHGSGEARPSIYLALGDISLTVWLDVPDDLELRVPPPRSPPTWVDRFVLDVPIVVGRCAIRRADLGRLAPRQLVTLEAPTTDADRPRFRAPGELRADLGVLGGAFGVRASLGAVVVEVVTGYIPRDMALPDDAHVELTVAVGTTQMSLRQLLDLSVGQVVSLGRPLAGPFEVRAEGRVLGRGELVDVDGELAVRIVSLGD